MELSRMDIFYMADDSLELAARFWGECSGHFVSPLGKVRSYENDPHGDANRANHVGSHAGHLFRAREIYAELSSELFPESEPMPWLWARQTLEERRTSEEDARGVGTALEHCTEAGAGEQ